LTQARYYNIYLPVAIQIGEGAAAMRSDGVLAGIRGLIENVDHWPPLTPVMLSLTHP
jgi:hypothetical protein